MFSPVSLRASLVFRRVALFFAVRLMLVTVAVAVQS